MQSCRIEMASIPEYFGGKDIFITGGSGFIGKVLIEKILRSCPSVGKIYFLLRGKKGKSIEERLAVMKNMAVFDILRKFDPDALDKIIPIHGDVTELQLGMTASVRFDDSLKYSIILNVRGTREVVNLALEVENLSVFVHISTTYCNADKNVVEEKIYPSHADWRSSIELAEECDDDTLKSMTIKFIHPLPNTYTFAKSLSEHVVDDMCKGKIPAVIIRPSIVADISNRNTMYLLPSIQVNHLSVSYSGISQFNMTPFSIPIRLPKWSSDTKREAEAITYSPQIVDQITNFYPRYYYHISISFHSISLELICTYSAYLALQQEKSLPLVI
ncbi:hypothetical protein JTB14_022828 [Gonioctena quinquepunctata]|nr:hypothetical protein JTB14_022828 [Gonioctena quinquepunctata]